MITPAPTKTFVIDVGRKCQVNCKFCYHHHLGDLSKQTFKDYDTLVADIDAGIDRGNNYMDVTGGEPTIYPRMTDIIKYALSKNIRTCLITNAVIGRSKTDELLNSGLDEFLVSVHGLEESHDYQVCLQNARKAQIKFLERIQGRVKLRFNCVINKFNQTELLSIAKWMAQWDPHIVNFINMNLHHGWKHDSHTAKDIIADLKVVEPVLNESIEFLESKGIGVNVRYYPMCRIKSEYRRTVCNDLIVTLDPYEWDYDILPKTVDRNLQHWKVESSKVEEKGSPCCRCDLQWICGGANRYFHSVNTTEYGESLIPQSILDINKNDAFYYRKYNTMTLGDR